MKTGGSPSWTSIFNAHFPTGSFIKTSDTGGHFRHHERSLGFAVTCSLCLVALILPACERCNSAPGAITQKQGDTLAWEQISLGVPADVFHKRLTELSLVDAAAAGKPSCRDQYIISVPDFDDNEIVERSAASRRLTNCLIRETNHERVPNLLEIRGEFLDNRLNRLSFRFKPSERVPLRHTLENRFGKGAVIVFRDRLMMTEEDIPCQIWSEGDESWLLTRAEQDTVLLVHQNWKEGMSLPPAPKASVRGKPVSLEDIGIGKLDLNAPLPEMDIPDASPGAQ